MDVTVVLEIAAIGGLPTLIGLLLHARGKNRKLAAEAAKLGAENVQVVSATAMSLITPLKERIAEVEHECDELRKQVKELTAEVEHQRQIANETTSKLELANKRADYYQRAFDARSGE